MTLAEAKKRVLQLRETINAERYRYHVLDEQGMSDAALDSLKHELYKLEQEFPQLITADSPTQRVGGAALPAFQKVTHAQPMLSMEDVFAPEEFDEWVARIAKLAERPSFDLFCMVKVDGLACSIVYEDGLLSVAATRGDGRVGENITENVKTVDAVPLALRTPSAAEMDTFCKTFSGELDERAVRRALSGRAGRIEVRGEVYMTVKAFEALNAAQKKKGEELYANPRNVAAGAIRQLDPKITASRKLSFFAWDIVTDLGQRTHAQEWEMLRLFGFVANRQSTLARSVEEVHAFWHDTQKRREKLGYWIDGSVVRVNDNVLFGRLGVVGKTPRAMVAWKFPAEEVTTVVESVSWQVGRTGALTPVAHLRPVWLGGTTVQNASLHNADEIERLGLKLGDTVILYKAGDIIPKVKQVLTDLRPKGAKSVPLPKKCPACGEAVGRREGEVAIVCTNRACPAKQVEFMANFVSKRAFDIDGLGYKVVEQLMDGGLLSTPADLFKLTKEELMNLERFGEKSAENLVAAIAARRSISLPRFIIAMGITHVGDETAIDIAGKFGTVEKFLRATPEELAAINGIGEVVAQAVSQWLSDKHHQKMVADLLDAGLKVEKVVRAANQPWTGKSFVFTGGLETMTRDEAKDKARALGADISESVSKKTDFVVAGSDAGSKLDKAVKLGVRVLNEEEFLAMLRKV